MGVTQPMQMKAIRAEFEAVAKSIRRNQAEYIILVIDSKTGAIVTVQPQTVHHHDVYSAVLARGLLPELYRYAEWILECSLHPLKLVKGMPPPR